MKNFCAGLSFAWTRCASATLLFLLFLTAKAIAAPADLPAGFPAVALKGRMRGEAAVAALGNKLANVAAFYRMPEAELKRLLRRDKMLWVNENGRLVYICEFNMPENAEALSADISPIDNGPVDRTQTFLLHSRKGSTKVAYLDFDGHDASTTSWGADAIAVPFDLDGNESNFSSTERDRIQYIWQRVAEDYAMYDIDITTEDPGIEALRKSSTSDANYGVRVVIGGASGDWYGSAGGVAFVGSFDDSTDNPCWVFPGSLSQSEKNIAEAISHEVGHTLSLNHDGKTDGTSYYSGQGNWAPIMGVGYYEPVTQWSKGEYNLANNLEDDLAKMLTQGVAYRADDNGNSTSAATFLPGVSFITNGVIERNTDVDFFKFQTGAGRATVTVTPAPRGANLHILLSLYNSAGTLLQTANTADTTAGVLPATISTVLPTGTYYFSIDGVGEGLPASTGYSDYASLGQYIISGTLIPDSSWLPVIGGTFSWINSANWLSNNVPDSADVTARLVSNLVGDQIVTLDKSITVGSLFLGDTNSTHSFTVQSGAGGSLAFSRVSGEASLIKRTGVNDAITADISLLSNLSVENSSGGTLTLSGSTSGTGALNKTGAGALILDGSQNYSGATTISAGTLKLGASTSLSNTISVQVNSGATLDASALPSGWSVENNRTLSGSGVVLGDVQLPSISIISSAGGTISPGVAGAGTLSLSNHLTLNSASVLNFDLSNSSAIGGGTNDLLVVGGNLSINGSTTIKLNLLDPFPASPATYTLIRYGGTLTGAAKLSLANLSTRYTFTLDTSVPGEIRLNVSGAPASLVWQGNGSTNPWDLSSTNWILNGSPVSFANLDDVFFDDTGSDTPAINLSTIAKPSSVSIAAAKNYTIAGSGRISGTTGIAKQGSGTLSLNTSNDFSGAVSVSNGTLKTGHGSALGAATGSTTIASGARLELNGQNLGAEPIIVAGTGPTDTGALINSSTTQTNALRFVTLTGDTTFGGSGRWDVRANPTGSFTGNSFALTKAGANEVWLADVGATGLGNINVVQGLFGVQGSTTLGNTVGTLTASAGTRIGIWNTDGNVLNKRWVLNDASVESLFGNNAISGTITINGTNVFNSASIFQVQGAISGPGALLKTGTGALTLVGANTFTGNLMIGTGTLIAGNAAALGATNGNTIISNDARLDLNGYSLGSELVVAQGNGLGNAGAIVNSGSSQNNALRFVTLSNNTTFGGIGRWDIRPAPTASLIGNNFALTKAGGNTVYLVDLGNTGLGNITISEGTLGIQGNSTLGNVANTLSIASAATLALSATGTNILTKTLAMTGGKISNVSGSNTFSGTTTLSGSNAFDIASATTLALTGNSSGSGAVWKSSTGTLVLTGANNYSGVTVISAGTIQLGVGTGTGTLGTGAITNNGTLTFNRGNDFSVANNIYGTGSIHQNGTGTVTLSAFNTYSGSTVINSGTLAIGNDFALGASVLNFNGNNGTIRSSSATTRTLVNELILGGTTATFGGLGTGNLTFNGSGANNGTLTKTLIVSNAITTINNAITNRGAIVKSGPGTLVFGGNNTYTNITTVLAGTLRIDAENRLGLNPASFNPAQLLLNGGTLQTLTSFAIADSNRGISLGSGGGNIDVNSGATLTLAKPVAGSGALTKVGGGTLLCTAPNSFSGATIISGGTVALTGAGVLTSTPLIDIATASAVLDVSGVVDFAIGSSQSLVGAGTILGNALINGTISPSGAAGKLTFANDLQLRGTTLLDLNKTGSLLTNDVLAVAGSLSLGGSLVVTASGDALSAGDAFQIFSGTMSNSFANLTLPPLPSSLIWDTTHLGTDGTLRVTVSSTEILPPTFDGTNLVLSVQTQTGLSYILQSAPSLIAPVSWTDLSTNAGSGALLSLPVPVDPNASESYFRFVVK